MNQWYYAPGGQQQGPVTLEQLREIARGGGLASTDLVWNSTMKDWLPAGQVPGIFDTPAVPASDPSNPYAAPATTWTDPARSAGEALAEIVPGSEPINVVGCIKRGFELTIRNFGMILLLGVVFFGVTLAVEGVLSALDPEMRTTIQRPPPPPPGNFSENFSYGFQNSNQGSWWHILISQVLSMFLTLGLIRVGLNLVSGRAISVGMLFGEGRKLLKVIGASILFGIMVAVGLVLLVIPGFYVMLRFGQFMNAIVDRDLGVIDSLKYSSSITTNNRVNLLLLWLLTIVVMIAGLLALCLGIFLAMPVVWLGWLVAYRWMQYGSRAAMDHPGTKRSMLAELEGSRMIG